MLCVDENNTRSDNIHGIRKKFCEFCCNKYGDMLSLSLSVSSAAFEMR